MHSDFNYTDEKVKFNEKKVKVQKSENLILSHLTSYVIVEALSSL